MGSPKPGADDGSGIEDAITQFARTPAQSMPRMRCAGWTWNAGIDPEHIGLEARRVTCATLGASETRARRSTSVAAPIMMTPAVLSTVPMTVVITPPALPPIPPTVRKSFTMLSRSLRDDVRTRDCVASRLSRRRD
jgi:hypothetical protein